MWETTKTYAWRFLNPKRASVLDIDTDIEGGRRSQVLDALREYYGQDRVANIVTFGTEGSKSAVQTAARGLGINNDIALEISALIPADRGKVRTLSQCYYGDDEFNAVPLFVQKMNEYPQLWEVAQKIEGLICRVGEHAGGVIFVDEPFTNSTALMKIPSGDVVTQFDLHDCEDCSLIKIDLLSIEALDKIHFCMDLLIDQGYMTPEDTLRKTYEKYLSIYNLERSDSKMWEMVWNHSIQSLFQMEKQSGIQGIALTKPESVDDLAVLNSVIRLMAQSPGEEQPLNKYARFKEDISQWYQEMTNYGLTKAEQELLKPILESSYGIAESQEKIMSLVQMPECGGFDLSWADSLRKAVAKKKPGEFLELQEQYFNRVKEKGLSEKLCSYVWNVLVAMSRGYSFNLSHTLAYSLVALQEMNLAHRFPIIFWNCACLIADSGGAQEEEKEEEDVVDIYEPEDFEEFEYEDAEDKKTKKKKKRSKSNNYDKIATAIGKMRGEGINIVPPDINHSSYTFVPDVPNNRILFGLRGMLNVGDDLIEATIANRPYASPRDYLQKVNPKKGAMISLIKAGAFDEMMDRKQCMAWYIWETCDKKNNLTLQNMPTLIKYGMLPKETDEQRMAFSVYEFNRYLKVITKADPCSYDGMYTLDARALDFINKIDCESLIETDNLAWFIKIKVWDKVYQKYMNVFRNWLQSNKEEILKQLNDIIFLEQWDKYAKGTISAWEMEAMCYYYHDHELAEVDKEKYGFTSFFDLPEEPEIASSFFKGGKQINLFKLSKIYGTCIGKNKDKGTLTLLTPEGVVSVRFRKEYFALFDKQISERGPDGVKHVIEKGWFGRGSMVVVQGMRSGDQFIAKKYASSGGHQLYKIKQVLPHGNIILQTERAKGED
jgi:DNA polymerase-3 subunit alpha